MREVATLMARALHNRENETVLKEVSGRVSELAAAFPGDDEVRSVDSDEMAAFARSHGYDFTNDELEAEMELAQASGEGELSESDLDAVSGGHGIVGFQGRGGGLVLNCIPPQNRQCLGPASKSNCMIVVNCRR